MVGEAEAVEQFDPADFPVNWEELPADDKRLLRDTDKALTSLSEITSREDIPEHLHQFTADLRRRLTEAAKLIAHSDYCLYFVGSIGDGKSTSIRR